MDHHTFHTVHTVEELQVHPLFAALTRPPMRFGVTTSFLTLNMMVSVLVFMYSSSFSTLILLSGVLHAVGYGCCRMDPRFFELLFGWLSVTGSNKNRATWSCNSYDPF